MTTVLGTPAWSPAETGDRYRRPGRGLDPVTTMIRFDLTAAADALARSDEGVDPLPDDPALIAAYEGWCQQEADRYDEAQNARERADWLAQQCPDCHEGGTGDECDEHYADNEENDR